MSDDSSPEQVQAQADFMLKAGVAAVAVAGVTCYWLYNKVWGGWTPRTATTGRVERRDPMPEGEVLAERLDIEPEDVLPEQREVLPDVVLPERMEPEPRAPTIVAGVVMLRRSDGVLAIFVEGRPGGMWLALPRDADVREGDRVNFTEAEGVVENLVRVERQPAQAQPDVRRDRPQDPPYLLDTDDGRDHSWQRHTRAGIWAQRDVLTDHADTVSLFDPDSALDDAIAAMPASREAWYYVSSSRRDADVGDFHYQGGQLGETMSLTSCYPTRGTSYPKLWLRNMLRSTRCTTATQFWTSVESIDGLDRRYRAGPAALPGRPSETDAQTFAALRRDASEALDRFDAVGAGEAMDEIDRMVAAVGQAAETRDAEIQRTRTALNDAIKANNVDEARRLAARMQELRTFFSPTAVQGLAAMGIVVESGI